MDRRGDGGVDTAAGSSEICGLRTRRPHAGLSCWVGEGCWLYLCVHVFLCLSARVTCHARVVTRATEADERGWVLSQESRGM